MDSVAIWIDDDGGNERVQRKLIRDKSNILSLSDKSFIKNFRLSKEAFIYVLEEIHNELAAHRTTAVPPILKLAVTLTFLGKGCYQHQIGKDWHLAMAQQTISDVIEQVCCAILTKLCQKHINFVTSDMEKQECKRYFYEKSGIPGVIGVVDGTHIQVIRPHIDEHLFFNRKLKHSINAMLICDHKMVIRAVNGRYGGGSHDSHIWHLSNERAFLLQAYENGEKSSWLIGDSGYPLEPWIITPYRNAGVDSSESNFNDRFSKIRSNIERVNGVLKGRFRCLLSARELHYSPQKAVKFLNVCCALHNICILFNVHFDENLAIVEEDDIPEITSEFSENNVYANIAKRLRDKIKNNLFNLN